MTKTFTENDVLKYFYNEVSKLEKEKIEDFLSCNNALTEFYCELLTTEELLEGKLEKPTEKTIQNILDYSNTLCLQN